MIGLFYLWNGGWRMRLGGAGSFTAHLHLSLPDSEIFLVGKRFERNKKPFKMGTFSQRLTVAEAKTISVKVFTFVSDNDMEAFNELCDHRSIVVLHDHQSVTLDFLTVIRKHEPLVVVIRQCNLYLIPQYPRMWFIPHPYVRCSDILPKRKHRAVCLSKISKQKGIDTILDACDRGADIKLYGGIRNEFVLHHWLGKRDWKQYYLGPYPMEDHGAKWAALGKYVVDLTKFADGDGHGGTQYTFLEAFDALSTLVLDRTWGVGELVPYRHYIPVSGVNELIDVLHSNEYLSGGHILHEHSPEIIRPRWMEVIHDVCTRST